MAKTRNISEIITLVVLFALTVTILPARELPYKSKDKFQQWNNEEISARTSIRNPDYGRTKLVAGTKGVKLRVTYASKDSFFAFVQWSENSVIANSDTLHQYVVRRIKGDSIQIYSIGTHMTRDLTDTSTVEYLTFMKDR